MYDRQPGDPFFDGAEAYEAYLMRHDKRGEDGKYRDRYPAEERCERAKMLTQTHEGRFTHPRDAAERRMPFDIEVPYVGTPYFKGQKFNRDPKRPRTTK